MCRCSRRGAAANAFGDNWVSPTEAQLPTPISQPLLDDDLAADAKRAVPRGAVCGPVYLASPPETNVLPPASVTLRPERGRFHHDAGSPPLPGEIVASYCYGFPSAIGAGPYDRRIGTLVIATPVPTVMQIGGSTGSVPLPGGGTVVLADSLTYAGIGDTTVQNALTLRAGNLQRPLIRLMDAVRLTGTPGSRLTLEGIFVSGDDIVLQGSFESVTLSCCTLRSRQRSRGCRGDHVATRLALRRIGRRPRTAPDAAVDRGAGHHADGGSVRARPDPHARGRKGGDCIDQQQHRAGDIDLAGHRDRRGRREGPDALRAIAATRQRSRLRATAPTVAGNRGAARRRKFTAFLRFAAAGIRSGGPACAAQPAYRRAIDLQCPSLRPGGALGAHAGAADGLAARAARPGAEPRSAGRCCTSWNSPMRPWPLPTAR